MGFYLLGGCPSHLGCCKPDFVGFIFEFVWETHEVSLEISKEWSKLRRASIEFGVKFDTERFSEILVACGDRLSRVSRVSAFVQSFFELRDFLAASCFDMVQVLLQFQDEAFECLGF